MSWNCEKCGSKYLREEDAQKCFEVGMEKPLIEVGKILIDGSYDIENDVRCYAINKNGHELCYLFEWIHPDSGDWEHVWSIHSNDFLKSFFGDQVNSL